MLLFRDVRSLIVKATLVVLLSFVCGVLSAAETTSQDSAQLKDLKKHAESGAPRPAGWGQIKQSAVLGSIFVVQITPIYIQRCNEENPVLASEISELLELYKTRHNSLILAGEKILVSGTEDFSGMELQRRMDNARKTIDSRFDDPKIGVESQCKKYKVKLNEQLELAELADL